MSGERENEAGCLFFWLPSLTRLHVSSSWRAFVVPLYEVCLPGITLAEVAIDKKLLVAGKWPDTKERQSVKVVVWQTIARCRSKELHCRSAGTSMFPALLRTPQRVCK